MRDGMPDPSASRRRSLREACNWTARSLRDGPWTPRTSSSPRAPRIEAKARRLLPLLAPSGFIWVSWPKKASKVPTDITEDTIRDVCLPMGLVDVKVCAVDAIWSGLKLMKRKAQ